MKCAYCGREGELLGGHASRYSEPLDRWIEIDLCHLDKDNDLKKFLSDPDHGTRSCYEMVTTDARQLERAFQTIEVMELGERNASRWKNTLDYLKRM